MKPRLTISWGIILVVAIIAVFLTFCNLDSIASMYYREHQIGLAIRYCFSIRGYILTNVTLIGAYIMKLIEIWGKEDD